MPDRKDSGEPLSTRTPLRLLLVLTEFPPRIGGMQTHAAALAQELVTRGHEVLVLTYRVSTQIEHAQASDWDSERPYEVRRELTRLSHEENLRVIGEHVEAFGPHLLYASTVFYGEIQTRHGVPVIARSVGNDVLRPWIVYPFRPFSKLVSSRWFEDRAYRFFRNLDYPERLEALWRGARRARMITSAQLHESILANSQFTKGLLCDIGVAESRVQKVIGGVDAERFETAAAPRPMREDLGIPEDATVLLTACRLVKKKAVDFLIRGHEQLRESVPNAHLLIVGGGREEKRLRKLWRNSPVQEHITFAGRIPHEEVAALYEASDIFVLASRVWTDPGTGLCDAETMGRVLCEANAAGIPVLAARSGGIPSVIEHEDNGLLFDPDDLESYVSTAQRLVEDAALSDALAVRGREIARLQFDWSHIVDAHEEAFFEAVS